MNKIAEKLILLAIGTGVTFITFLASSYFSGFVTKADYNKDKAEIEVIKTKLDVLKSGQEEIKKLIKKY